MFIHNRLTQHVSDIIMPVVRRTDCIKPRVVLAWMCWLRLCGVWTRAERPAVRSARVPTSHNRSQHIQANTTRGFIQSVLLTMGILMPETCWVKLLWINIYTCVICWFFLLLEAPYFYNILRNLKTPSYVPLLSLPCSMIAGPPCCYYGSKKLRPPSFCWQILRSLCCSYFIKFRECDVITSTAYIV